MTFRVRIAQRAQRDVESIYSWIAEHGPDHHAAVRWVDGLENAITSLDEFPARCPLAPEARFFERQVRQLLYHSHRVLFTIDEEEVVVLHIRHAGRLPATLGDLRGSET